ncbi:MAG: hypothetical protein ABFS46_01150 [Myxococcota bacterium]
MSRRVVQRTFAALAFGAAASCFTLGLAGRLSPWLAAVVASLGFLTIGFYLASPGSGRE